MIEEMFRAGLPNPNIHGGAEENGEKIVGIASVQRAIRSSRSA
jgi:hypothetical protein